IAAVSERWPDVLLQWEDFAGANAGTLLARYRDRLCSFNDDILGTAAIAAGTLLAAVNVTGIPLTRQRIAVLGAGSAGCGIAALLMQAMIDAGASPAEARSRFFLVDRDGLLLEGMPGMAPAQTGFLQRPEAATGWTLETPGRISLLDVVAHASPGVLIGVSGQAGAFTEPVIREMAKGVERPIIFPLSNPTSRSEATPEELMAWTEGRALIGTGSPFPPLQLGDKSVKVTQTNNSYIFPGVGLGVLAANARRVTDTMFMAAGKAVASISPTAGDPTAELLPPVTELRKVAMVVARAVARQAQSDGAAEPCAPDELDRRIAARMWEPRYRPYRRIG
ncbi:MAG: oxaloacetate-decarboxylating malate dehydrogenase, partial [Parvibaculaceae bacterium]